MSQGPYRQTLAFKLRKSKRDARYRERNRVEINRKANMRRHPELFVTPSHRKAGVV